MYLCCKHFINLDSNLQEVGYTQEESLCASDNASDGLLNRYFYWKEFPFIIEKIANYLQRAISQERDVLILLFQPVLRGTSWSFSYGITGKENGLQMYLPSKALLCVWMCVCEWVWIQVCVHVCTSVYTYACVPVCMHVQMYVCICICVCLFVCM